MVVVLGVWYIVGVIYLALRVLCWAYIYVAAGGWCGIYGGGYRGCVNNYVGVAVHDGFSLRE